MILPFLGRERELSRLQRAFRAPDPQLVVLVGRRRLGKSRLLREALRGLPAVYVVGDDRDAPLQRESVAREIDALIPGFASARYPGWDALLERWARQAPPGAILALDELPSLVARAPELPSLLQRLVDRGGKALHLALCGSSQRMMLGMVLDASAPLYGRAREILRVGPLDIGLLPRALPCGRPREVLDRWAVWGGVPRYWELAADYADPWEAVRDLALDPLGVLHQEPERLLLDDLRELARAGSLLSLVGQGVCRPSELASRLEQPTTSLTRPLARLLELNLLEREQPWGVEPRDTKRALYRVSDPFLAFWYRFVDPARSRLAAGQVEGVMARVQAQWTTVLGPIWEKLARDRLARMSVAGEGWLPAGRWWSKEVELDLVAAHESDPRRALVGEVKLTARPEEVPALRADLAHRAARCPALEGWRVEPWLWVLEGVPRGTPGVCVGEEVLGLEPMDGQEVSS